MPDRALIQLNRAELSELLDTERVAIVSTIGPRGWPHSMPLWFLQRDGDVWVSTYASSQKVRNLRRDPRATLLVEAGGEYSQLRGAMIEAEARIHHDLPTVRGFIAEITRRYAQHDALLEDEVRSALRQAPKRVVIQFCARRTVSWDHRKLGAPTDAPDSSARRSPLA